MLNLAAETRAEVSARCRHAEAHTARRQCRGASEKRNNPAFEQCAASDGGSETGQKRRLQGVRSKPGQAKARVEAI